MKTNKLSLTKTISDFMFLGVDNPEEKAKQIFVMKTMLTAHWFEKYMQYYFMYKKWYKIKLNGNTYQVDGCIDLKWVKKEKWKEVYMIAQCKKYWVKDISESMIREFGWAVSLPKYTKYADRTEKYYITTSKYTYKAQQYWKELWIHMINFYDLYKLQAVYSFEDFKKDVLKFEGITEKNKCLEKEQLLLDLDDEVINTVEASDKQVMDLLKQVRRDISNTKQLRLGSIARNDTLEILARKRPHNLEALKKATSNLTTREKNKLNKYWEIFIERLKYVHQEETPEDVSMMKKLLGFLG